MPKALLFDLDGTLSNTDAVHFPNWIEILRPYGVEVTRELYEEKLSGRVDREAVESVLPDLPGEEVDELLEREELRARQRSSEIGPLPGLRGLIEAGRRRGWPLAPGAQPHEADARAPPRPRGSLSRRGSGAACPSPWSPTPTRRTPARSCSRSAFTAPLTPSS